MIYKLILLVVLLNRADCFAQDSTILQIYNFNENRDNFTGDIFNGDSLAKDALLIKAIIDFHKIVDFQSNFDKLIKESDFIGNITNQKNE